MQWLDYVPWRDRFAKAIDPRLYTLEYVDSLIQAGTARLWTSPEAAIVAQIRIYPSGARVICGVLAAGDLGQIENDLIPQAEQWGRENGCILALIEGRGGWSKVMKKHGYGPFVTVIEKDL
jgi:hypothetical protein